MSLAPALLLHLILRVEGMHAVFYLYLAAGNLHFHIRERSAAYRESAAPLVSLLLYGLGGLAVFIFILITPYSGYMLWFDLIRSGAQRGIISFTLLLTMGYLCLIAAGGVRGDRRLAPVLLGLHLALLVVFIIWRQAPVFALSVGLYLAARIVPAVRGRRLFGAARGPLAMGSLAVLAAAAALALSIGRSPGGVEIFDTVVSQALRRGVVDIFPEFPVLYGIPGFGYHYSSDNFSDRPVLSERPLFYVTAPSGSTLYLRSLVYDTYASRGWQRLRTPALDGPVREPVFADAAALEQPPAADESRVEVELSADFYPYYLHTLKTTSIVLRPPAPAAGQTVPPPPANKPLQVKGSKNTALEPERPLIGGDRFVIIEKEQPPAPPLPDARGGSNPRAFIASRISSLYGAVPSTITPALRTLAGRLAGRNPRQIPSLIRGILHDGYTYTLTPPAYDQARDFVSEFLFTNKAGYCVHFASAATVLARLAGIPARYVSGFLVNVPYDEYADYDTSSLGVGSGSSLTVPVTGLTAHAWVELWYPETGWVVFEATPPMEPQAYDDPEFWQRYLTPGGLTARQLSAITGNRLTSREAESAGAVFDPWILVYAAAGLAGAFGLAAGLFFLFTHKWKKRQRRTGFEALASIAARAVRRARRRGVPHPRQIGWLDWERRVKASLAAADCVTVDGRLGLFREGFFAGRRLSASELKELRRLVGKLR